MFPIKTLATSMAFIGASFGATCETGTSLACGSQDGALGRNEHMWSAREDYCGNNKWQSESCYKYTDTDGWPAIYIQNSQLGANSQQTCWDALEDIINQCISNDPGVGEAFGYYDYNGQRYRMGACSSAYVC